MDNSNKRVTFIIVLMLVVFLGALLVRPAMHSDKYESAYQLPLIIGDWKGEDAGSNLDSLRSILGAQSIVFRTYSNTHGSVTLYLAYYKDVNSANNVHAPTVCYPGQGWTIKADDVITLDVLDKKMNINRLVIQKEREKDLVYNWWQTGETVIPRNSTNRFHQMLRGILGRNPSTIWVRISARLEASMESNENQLVQFTGAISPLLGNYFKN